jgi:hypothetical protein
LIAAAAVAVGAYLLRPQLTGDSAEAGAQGSAQSASPTAGGDAVTAGPTAPYTIKPEPTGVATDAPPTASGPDVEVVLSFLAFDDESGAVEANGFAAGVIEDGGTCTLTLTRRGDEVTATSTAMADATTTSCGLLATAPGLASGSWTAVLSYASDKASGESRSAEVVVP